MAYWQSQDLSSGTIKNRLSHLRWWAGTIGKPAIIARDNGHYQVARRVYVTGEDKARDLDDERLANVTDPTRACRFACKAFGLRREEAIKFSPTYADKGDKIVLKASWTKGGKARKSRYAMLSSGGCWMRCIASPVAVH